MKRSKKLLLILLVMGTIVLSIFVPIKIKADSGFDFDYDSGGGGSDFDFGDSDSGDFRFDFKDEDGHYRTSDIFDVVPLIFMFVWSGFFFYYIMKVINHSNHYKNEQVNLGINSTISEEEVRQYLPNFNKEEFLDQVYQIFTQIQTAWMNFKLEDVRDYLSDELYNMYTSQLNTLKIKNQKNIMENFYKKYVDIIKVTEENGKVSLDVRLIVKFKDYIIDEQGNIVRGDLNDYLTTYILTFIVSKELNRKTTCPNCHAPVHINHGSKCEYCDSVIVNNNFDMILTKKQFISKRKV